VYVSIPSPSLFRRCARYVLCPSPGAKCFLPFSRSVDLFVAFPFLAVRPPGCLLDGSPFFQGHDLSLRRSSTLSCSLRKTRYFFSLTVLQDLLFPSPRLLFFPPPPADLGFPLEPFSGAVGYSFPLFVAVRSFLRSERRSIRLPLLGPFSPIGKS